MIRSLLEAFLLLEILKSFDLWCEDEPRVPDGAGRAKTFCLVSEGVDYFTLVSPSS